MEALQTHVPRHGGEELLHGNHVAAAVVAMVVVGRGVKVGACSPSHNPDAGLLGGGDLAATHEKWVRGGHGVGQGGVVVVRALLGGPHVGDARQEGWEREPV